MAVRRIERSIRPTVTYDLASQKLARLFDHYRDQPLLLVEPGGNAGDYLIYRGAERIAQHMGIRYTSIDCDTYLDGYAAKSAQSVLYVHGSGGFNPWWSGTPMKILEEAAHSHTGVLIVGPSTFFPKGGFLDQQVVPHLSNASCKRIHVFARERPSYRALRPLLPAGIHLDHDHDTAFNADVDSLTPSSTNYSYRLIGIRDDKEATEVGSSPPAHLRVDPPQACPDFEDWIALHAGVTSIVTNRLHSAILGALLSTPTTLLPNSYFKNRAVWEYSLSDRNVAWSDSLPPAYAVDVAEHHQDHTTGLVEKLRQWYRLQRLTSNLMP